MRAVGLLPRAAMVMTLATMPGVVGVQGAGAAGRAASAASQPAPTHCVLAVTASGKAAEPACHGSFRAAIARATGGAVTDAPAAAAAATDPAFAAKVEPTTAASSYVLGIEYADANYGGSTLTISAPGICDSSADVDWQFPTMPTGWNDQISSFRSFNRCEQQLYRDIFYVGALTPVVANMSWVGTAANDRASSVRFF